MAQDETVSYAEVGVLVRVHGKRTETTGTLRGIGLTEDGKPRIVLHVDGAPCPFAYDFDEIERIEIIG